MFSRQKWKAAIQATDMLVTPQRKEINEAAERIAALETALKEAVEKEREACAQRCEIEHDGYQAPRNGWDISDLTQREYFGYQEGCYDCAKAILSRGAVHD